MHYDLIPIYFQIASQAQLTVPKKMVTRSFNQNYLHVVNIVKNIKFGRKEARILYPCFLS